MNGIPSPFAIPLRDHVTGEEPSTQPEEAPGVYLAHLRAGASERTLRAFTDRMRQRGLVPSYHELGGGLIAFGKARPADILDDPDADALIADLRRVDSDYRLVRREVVPEGSQVMIGNSRFGAGHFGVIAGPCAVESRSQILSSARMAAAAGIGVLRGGAFKPRTSPYAFQGLGLRGVELLAEAGRASGLPFVTEVLDPADVEPMYPLVDAFQVGARNMQNYALLKALGDIDKPVLLKRGPSATLDEWLLAAEYLLAGGNHRVILCERGVRTFNPSTRFTLDLATMALARRETHLPIIVDPSHATGNPDLVLPMALAALAAGADGLMFEFHPRPSQALSDGAQALRPEDLDPLMAQLAALAPVVGRKLS
jgi:3-deoxy-7-phosphoheptulonate synthase